MANDEPRWVALDRALYDVSLSCQARLLYSILDRLSGRYAEWKGRQQRLVLILGASPREFTRALTELKANHVTVLKGFPGCRYILPWHKDFALSAGDSWGGVLATGGQNVLATGGQNLGLYPYIEQSSKTTEQSIDRPFLFSEWHLTACACGMPFLGAEMQLCRIPPGCGRVHQPASSPILDPLAYTAECLASAGRRLEVPLGHPDPQIALRALEAAKNPVALYHGIRALVLSGRAAQARSYAWFVTVLQNRAA